MATKMSTAPKILNTGKKVAKLKKRPKTVVKTILKNPFALEWSVISEEFEQDVISQIELCCADLQIPIFKPSWKEIQKLKGEERIKYCQEYKKSLLEKLHSDPDAADKYETAKEARSHLIFGFNAVMRAMEQNRLAGILCRKDVKPPFLVQTFVPGCVEKLIPLVPVVGLDDILKRENTLAVKHKVMILGLKLSVRESSCRFYPLYSSMRKTLESMDQVHKYFETDNLTGSKLEANLNKENHELKVEDSNVSKCKLTPEEIKSYHLKRSDKSKRVFVPMSKNININILDLEEDVISIEPSTTKSHLKRKENSSDNNSSYVKKPEKAKERLNEKKDTDFNFEFFFDTTGGDNMEVAEKNLHGNSIGEEAQDDTEKMTKRKNIIDFKPTKTFTYLPAKAKRIKNNPNRKSNKKKQ